MLKLARLPLLVLVCIFASGCITAITTIKLQPDGSGTIEQSMAMKAAMAEQLAAMSAGMGGGAAKPGESAEPELFSEKEMREAATKYGEGVTFVSSRPIKTDDLVGRVAIYKFADISKVRINQKPPSPGKGTTGAPTPAEDVHFTFARRLGGTSLVTVVFPEHTFDKSKKPGEKTTEAQKPDPAQLEMAKKFLDGLHIEIALDVAGSIVKTNSPYVDGSRVTLLELDFSQLMSNEKVLSELTQPGSIEEAKQMLAGMKGVKVNLDKDVSVEFR